MYASSSPDSIAFECLWYVCKTPACIPGQKLCQLTEEQHAALHDISCLWLWLRKQMETEFPGDVISRHDELFANGYLVS